VQDQTRYTLDCLIELAAISPAEWQWFQYCTNTDVLIENLLQDASRTIDTRDHWHHMATFEQKTSDHAFANIPNEPNPLNCYLTDLQCFNSTIQAVCDMEDANYKVNAERIVRSFNRSFEVICDASNGQIQKVLNQRAEQERQRKIYVAAAIKKRTTYPNDVEKYIRIVRKNQIHKRQRSIFRRSVNRAISVFGRPLLDSIMQSRVMEVAGQLYRYRLTLKQKSLIGDAGHGTTTLTVLTLGGEEVCDLCIYGCNCTLLDYFVSVYVHVVAGEELDILSMGNVSLVHKVHGQTKNAEDLTFIMGKTYIEKNPTSSIYNEEWREAYEAAECRKQNIKRHRTELLPRINTRGLIGRLNNLIHPEAIQPNENIVA